MHAYIILSILYLVCSYLILLLFEPTCLDLLCDFKLLFLKNFILFLNFT